MCRDPASIFEGVRKLPPGHWLEWRRGHGVVTGAYWQTPAPTTAALSADEAVEELRVRLEAAVTSHLESEVPLGAFLSGGLDSSTVVALMARHAGERVKTFSIGFDESEFDESQVARKVAETLGADHTELILRPDVETTLDAIATMFDEPFGDSSAIPTFYVAQLARQSVTVSLSGDGGDELFGGYSRYRESLGGPPTFGAAGALLQTLGRWLPHAAPGRNKLIDIGRGRWGRYLAKVCSPVRLDEGGFARPGLPGADTPIDGFLADIVADVAGDDLATGMMRIDFASYLPGDILTKVIARRWPCPSKPACRYSISISSISRFRCRRHIA